MEYMKAMVFVMVIISVPLQDNLLKKNIYTTNVRWESRAEGFDMASHSAYPSFILQPIKLHLSPLR